MEDRTVTTITREGAPKEYEHLFKEYPLINEVSYKSGWVYGYFGNSWQTAEYINGEYVPAMGLHDFIWLKKERVELMKYLEKWR